MTTISAIPTLDMEFVPPEDTMELASSPHMQQDDLDLDLDTAPEFEVAPEDSMVEDAFHDDHLEIADHFDDDVMFDGDAATQHFPDGVSDLNMEAHHEHETALEDEDILYEDDEVSQESGLVQPANDSVKTGPESNHTQEYPALMSGDVEVSEAHLGEDLAFAEQDTEDQPPFLPKSPDADGAEGSYDQSFENEQQDADQLSHTFEAPEYVDGEIRTDNQGQTTEPGLDLEDATINTNPKDTTESLRDIRSRDQDSVDYANNGAGDAAAVEQLTTSLNAQDVALHTVKVMYQDNEIFLFPPPSEEGAETFFLSEYRLAHETLDKLLASCREVLADTIGDDDELVLDVASLGLHISEGSKYAAEITLLQILDVYLKLSHNDGVEQIEPLYCNLSSRVCLASQYAYLTAAAQEGKTMTEIIAENMNSPESEPLEEEPGHGEQTELDTEYYEVTETSLPAPDQSRPVYEHDDEEADDSEANEVLEGQKDDHLEITEHFDNLEAVNNEEQRDITGDSPTNETNEVAPLAGSTHNLGSDEADIEPAYTEYQEDVDDVAKNDRDDSPQEQVSAAEQDVETVGANHKTASSDTVEAEVKHNQEQHLEEIFEQDVDHFEQYDDDSYQPDRESNGFQAADEQHTQAFEANTEGAASNEYEEDLLDLGPENQEQPSVNQVDLVDKVDEMDFQDLEDNEDLFDGGDASTDQTLDNTQGDDEDDLDVFLPPATPAKTRSTKRKVEADDDDVFDLLDTETPDKKRRRPS